jgi:glucokinase
MLIAGDIGGTKTDLAIYTTESGPHAPIAQRQFRSAQYPSLQAIVGEFLADVNLPVDRACFDVAGPVIDGHVRTTNLPWDMDEVTLAKELSFRVVHLLNDLEAVARAVPVLRPADIITVHEGQPVEHGAIAVIAPGTGLGESFLTWNGAAYIAHSSEGGHSDFAPADGRQIRLLQFMFERLDHVGVERVCSGIGIPNIFEYLRDVERIPEDAEFAKQLARAEDRTRMIVDAAVSATAPNGLCRATVEMFVSILAAEAGNLVLKVLGTGGVYMTGSLAVRAVPMLQQPAFLQAFTNKGRFRELMNRVPVHVITARAALLGAAAYGLEALYGEQEKADAGSTTVSARLGV